MVHRSRGDAGLGPVDQVEDGLGPGRTGGRQVERGLAVQQRMRADEEGFDPPPVAVIGAADGVEQERKSVGWGKGVSVRVDLGGRRTIKTKNKSQHLLYTVQYT